MNMNMLRIWGGGDYEDDYFIPVINSFFKKGWRNRTILVASDGISYRIIHDKTIQIDILNGYITGNLDSCANTITVENQNGIEPN